MVDGPGSFQPASLIYVRGDLLEADRTHGCNWIGHQCNARGAWRAGIHRQIGEQYPSVVAAYQRRTWSLGDVEVYVTPRYRIAYLCGQDGYGNAARTGRVYTDYDALSRALRRLHTLMPPAAKLGLPRIGAGLAGGVWTEIARRIAVALPGRTVWIFSLEEGGDG